MHIFGTTYFRYVENKRKLDPRCEKGIFVGSDKLRPAYLIYFPLSTAIKRVRCVKFTDSYDNSPLTKHDKNTELSDYISTTYDEQPKDSLNTEGEGHIRRYPIRRRRKPDFFVVENFPFNRLDCCTMCTIPTNYTDAINSMDSDNWILAMRKEFDSFVENNTFEWQRAPRNKNIVGSRCFFFTIKRKNDGSYEYKA